MLACVSLFKGEIPVKDFAEINVYSLRVFIIVSETDSYRVQGLCKCV